jgi:hypothetical protein
MQIEVESIEDGRLVERRARLGGPAESVLRRVTLCTDSGLVLASIPLPLYEGGPTWPPLPLQDWSMVSAAYHQEVAERLAVAEDSDDA